jgi:hypothetical protein
MTIAVDRADLLEHPATRAWAELRPERVEPRGIRRLQRKQRACVYRLEGVGPGGSDVIAKRSSRERILHERVIYEHVLPAISASTVRYHGCVEQPDGECCWLFVEDAVGEEYSPSREDHRVLAAHWLGLVHASAARVPAAACLPDRGPGHYREHLRSACDTILYNLANPALTAPDVAVLTTIIEQCEVVASHWGEVERVCGVMPRTLIHADFAPKNMRVRAGPYGLTLLPFDWGSAGWGVAAPDLAQWGTASNHWHDWASPDLATYCEVVRESWLPLTVHDVRPLAAVGRMFRSLACISLSARSFATEWVERAALNMRTYSAELADAIRAAEWTAGSEE